MKYLEEDFQDQSVDLTRARFACMDTTNVNSGERGGLKWYLKSTIPHLIWVGCGNHKLSLCFKHLLNQFPSVFETDVFLESLWKFFKYRPFAKNLLEESAGMYDENVVVPVAPSVTRWTAHECACKSVIKGYRQFVSSLTTCYNERGEPEAVGLLVQLCKPMILSTMLMLLEVFECTGPLGLLLQKGNGTLCLADIPTYFELTKSRLISRREEREWLTLKKLRELKNLAEEEILSLPVSARVRRTNQFNWESFMNETFHPCVAAFIEEIKEAFEQLQFRVNFTIFDPRKLLKAKEELKMCGNKELSEFLSHYPVSKAAVFKANRTSPAADFDFDKAKSEWSGFKDLMFQKRENYYHLIDSKIAAVQSPGNKGKTSVTNLKKKRTMFSAKLFWSHSRLTIQ